MKQSSNSLPPILTISEEKPFPRIQKQISLFEGTQNTSNAIDHDFNKFISAGCSKKLLNELRDRFETNDSTLLLAQSTSNDNFLFKNKSSNQSSKTKSCMNLKSCNFHHPGAIIVKEMFIEPPRRITRSFHGKTEHSKCSGSGSKSLDEDSYGINSGGIMMSTTRKSTSVQKLRFITTKVDESSDNK